MTRISTGKARLSTSPLQGLLRTPNLGFIMQIRVRSKEKIEEERRLMGFISQMESITHCKRKRAARQRKKEDYELGRLSGWTGGWVWRPWNRDEWWDLLSWGGAMPVSAREGHRWKKKILKRFVVVYEFFLHFHEMIVKTKFVFQLTFWLPDCFLPFIFIFWSWPWREKQAWLHEGYKGICLPPTLDQIL